MNKRTLKKVVAVGFAILTLFVIWNDGKVVGNMLGKAFLNE